MYTIPVFNWVASVALSRTRKPIQQVATVAWIGCMLITAVMVHQSSLNYPGGYALLELNKLARKNETVHLDVYACMNGITRFQYLPSVSYSKQEQNVSFSQFNWIVNEKKLDGFNVRKQVHGYAGLFKQSPKLFVQENLESEIGRVS
jgi:hypothetical protein